MIRAAMLGAVLVAGAGFVGMTTVSFIFWSFDKWDGGEIRLLIVFGIIGAIAGLFCES